MRLTSGTTLLLCILEAATLLPPDIPKGDVVAPKEAIRFPDFGPAPAPAPKPNPGEPQAIPTLTAETLYVIDSDTPFLVFASPPELVTLTKEAGPLRIRGKFIDSPPGSKVETRNFAGKQVVTIEANGVGRVEIIVIPAGATEEKSAIRKLIDVNNGAQPPPGPNPPGPTPPGPTPGPTTSFHVIWVHDALATLPQSQVSVMDAESVRIYLTANTTKDGQYAGWRRWDKNTDASNETATFKALWKEVKPQLTVIPCVVVERNGKADILPFPASPAEAIKLFDKYKGAK